MFLTEVNGFAYSHSEELGNAFEYLLQCTGAQGENGQFRTPHHIIDFIVACLDPQPGDRILDPACGMGLANGIPICELLAPCAFNQDIKALRPTKEVCSAYLAAALRREERQLKNAISTAAHGTLKIETDRLLEIEIPLPPLSEQRRLVAELDAEAAQMEAVRALLPRFEAKIQRVLDHVWGNGGAA